MQPFEGSNPGNSKSSTSPFKKSHNFQTASFITIALELTLSLYGNLRESLLEANIEEVILKTNTPSKKT